MSDLYPPASNPTYRIKTAELTQAFSVMRRLMVFPKSPMYPTGATRICSYGAIESQPKMAIMLAKSLEEIGRFEALSGQIGAGEPGKARLNTIKIKHNGVVHEFYMLHYDARSFETIGAVIDLKPMIDPDFDNRQTHIWIPMPVPRDAEDSSQKPFGIALARKDERGLERLTLLRERCRNLYRQRQAANTLAEIDKGIKDVIARSSNRRFPPTAPRP